MLALHLLQNCMVYINTLMLQQVLAQPKWADKLTPRSPSSFSILRAKSLWVAMSSRSWMNARMIARLI